MSLQDSHYLAATLYGEARGESVEGQVAVANVIRNRVLHKDKSYQDVCLEPLQFSCWNDTDLNSKLVRAFLANMDYGNPITDKYQRQCIAVAEAVCDGNFVDNVSGAENYVTYDRFQLALNRRDSKLDGWMLKLREGPQIGKHIFLTA